MRGKSPAGPGPCGMGSGRARGPEWGVKSRKRGKKKRKGLRGGGRWGRRDKRVGAGAFPATGRRQAARGAARHGQTEENPNRHARRETGRAWAGFVCGAERCCRGGRLKEGKARRARRTCKMHGTGKGKKMAAWAAGKRAGRRSAFICARGGGTAGRKKTKRARRGDSFFAYGAGVLRVFFARRRGEKIPLFSRFFFGNLLTKAFHGCIIVLKL